MRWRKFLFTSTATVYMGELIGGDFLETLTPQKLARFLGLMIVIALMAAGIVVTVYYSHFARDLKLPLSGSSADWGTFGDYIGGTLNPFLAFLSFLALVFTLLLQARQLELSREELHLSRDERLASIKAQEHLAQTARDQLGEAQQTTIAQMEAAEALQKAALAAANQSKAAERSAEAQKTAADAAKLQAEFTAMSARIAGLQAAIANLTERINREKGVHWSGPGRAPWGAMENKRTRLETELDHLVDSLSPEKQKDA